MKRLITLILACCLAPAAMSEEIDADAIIKYRQDVMTAIKGHNNAIKTIVSGKVPFAGRLDSHLASIERLFGEIDSLFPEGSDFGKTSAKDEIWDNPDEFKDTLAKSRQALNDFKQVASQGDLAKSADAFKQFGRNSCGSCHKLFKKKDD